MSIPKTGNPVRQFFCLIWVVFWTDAAEMAVAPGPFETNLRLERQMEGIAATAQLYGISVTAQDCAGFILSLSQIISYNIHKVLIHST
ncbi:hypothetical protein AAGR22_10965 [Erwinia sp. HDF1-3R]|uniref:hypothetical protein n=1 Tax=Erwinia sp. HDF1-3R TaxID=3141543 RepID=UPI0031F48446